MAFFAVSRASSLLSVFVDSGGLEIPLSGTIATVKIASLLLRPCRLFHAGYTSHWTILGNLRMQIASACFGLFSSLHLICLLRLDLAHVLLVFKLFSWSRTYINTVHQPPSSRSRIGPRTLHHARLSQASESFQASIMSAEPRIDHPAFPPSIYSPTATRNTSVSQPKAPAGPILISRSRSVGIMTGESRRRNDFTDMILNICRVSRKCQ